MFIIFITQLFVGSFLSGAEELRYSLHVKPILSNHCYKCHGPDPKARKADLRLDVEEGARAHLGSGSADAELYARITSADADELMPPPESGHELSVAEIDTLKRWLDMGAPFEKHWSFITPASASPPLVQDTAWPRNAIDNYILARLEEKGIAPAPEADKITLLRRVSLDLIGLPPTPEEVAAFLQDEATDAYEKVVDRLLASKHFGERWGRHWLDGARYADSNGYSIDGERSIWPYRDWVINAYNADMPFNQFVIEQMAGDLLPDATREQEVATGFHRNTMINQEGGVDPEEFRLESLYDRVNTTGTVFMGLTMACARCHTHKYDPIDHAEYYRMMAVYNGDDEPDMELPTEEQALERKSIQENIRERESDLKKYLEHIADQQQSWEEALPLKSLHTLDANTRNALAAPPAERNDDQKKLALEAFKKLEPGSQRRTAEIENVKKQLPKIAKTMILRQRPKPRETHRFEAGDFTRPAELVTPGVPAALGSLAEGAGTRLDLAKWICDPQNPLTARVTVNRLWMHLFGRGIVETENDFGTQGALPTHPELLDWLALRFIENGWSQKTLIREMVCSATYRQSSHARPELNVLDPDNKLLARQMRIRLDAEIVRDNALAASGLLNGEIGGPPVFPPQPDGVMNLGQSQREWKASEGAERYRRGLYTWFWRATPHPALTVFDAPTAQTSCTRRINSNTPLQALTLLNDAAFVEMAQALAKNIVEQKGSDKTRLEYAYQRCLGRMPEAKERATLQGLLDAERSAIMDGEGRELLAWTALSRALLNLDEFITRE